MNPINLSPPNSPPFLHQFFFKVEDPKDKTPLMPNFGPMLTEMLGQDLINKIPVISATSLGLFDREPVVLFSPSFPYLPNVSHNALDGCFLPQSQGTHCIHAAQGISELGRSFLAIKVGITTDKEEAFHMVEVICQKHSDNFENFLGVMHNATDFYGTSISSIYDGGLIDRVSAQFLRSLLDGQTIESPNAKRYGLSWMVKAV